MELRYLLRICQSYWRFITVVCTVAALMGLGATYVLPESFEASTQILIRPEQTPAFKEGRGKAMMDYPMGFNIPVGSISETYAEIMTSEAIATKVEDRLALHTIEEPEPEVLWLEILFAVRDVARVAVFSTYDFVRYGRIEPQLPPYWKTVDDIMDGLSAEPVSDTYIFTLTASWNDPDIAVQIADTAAEVFVEYSREARTHEEGTAAGFLAEQLAETRKGLDEARANLDVARARSGSASLDQELSLLLDDLAKFEVERQSARKQLHELDAEVGQIEGLLTGAGQTRTLHGEARAELESRLAVRLGDRAAVTARIEALGRPISEYRRQAASLGSHRGGMAQLTLELKLLEESYELLSKNYEDARIATGASMPEIRVLHSAIRPRYPRGPIKYFYTLGGLAVGLLFALGLVLLLDYADQRIRSSDDIEDSLGVPVLASVPRAPGPGRSARVLGQRRRGATALSWQRQHAPHRATRHRKKG